MMPTYQPQPTPLDPIETASTSELRTLQQTRLLQTIRPAHANSPHYRAVFGAAGLQPGDITSLDQLAQLPFTTKEELRRSYPFGMFAPRADRPHPRLLGYHRAAHRRRLHRRGSAHLGAADGTKPARRRRPARPAAAQRLRLRLFTGGLGVHAGAELLGCTVVPISGGMTERQVRLITDFQPDIITVHPHLHARHRRRNGPPRCKPCVPQTRRPTERL